jgi:hypothetical protein
MRLTVVLCQVQLHLEVVRYKSRYRLLAEDVLHGAVPQRLADVVRVDAVPIVGERRDELH